MSSRVPSSEAPLALRGRLAARHLPFPGQERVGYRSCPGSVHSGDIDVLLLGDSVTQAREVDEVDAWPCRLAATGLSVANLGVGGYGTTQEVALFRRYGALLKPKAVLVTLVPNDPADNEIFDGWRRAVAAGTARADGLSRFRFCAALGARKPSCGQFRVVGRLGTLPKLLVSRLLDALTFPRLAPRSGSAGMSLLIRDLRELHELLGARGVKLAVAMKNDWRKYFPASRSEIVSFLEREGIP